MRKSKHKSWSRSRRATGAEALVAMRVEGDDDSRSQPLVKPVRAMTTGVVKASTTLRLNLSRIRKEIRALPPTQGIVCVFWDTAAHVPR